MPDVFSRTAQNAKTRPLPTLASFCPHPSGITLADQEKNEQIILFLRRHFITNIPWIAITVMLLLLPPLFFVFSALTPGTILPIPQNVALVLVLFYYLAVLAYPLTSFISWFYNIGIVTTIRIIDIDSHNVLHQSVASTNLSDVVDAEYSQKGILQSHFDFGDVFVQTEGIKPNFEFHAAPQPAKVVNVIGDLMGGRDI